MVPLWISGASAPLLFEVTAPVASASSSLASLAGRYASALYELADGKKKLDAVADDLRGLKSLISESEDLRIVLASPMISRDDAGKAVIAVADKAGIDGLTRNFLGVVAAKRRLFALPHMIDAFLAELASRRGEATATVVSAKKLTQAQVKALEAQLKSAMGAKVSVDVTVDESLIGGMIVQVGSRMIDSSLRGKLQRLQFAMKGVG